MPSHYPRRGAEDDDGKTTKGAKKARATMMELARERFKQAAEADDAQAQREREDLRFYAGDQWPEDVKASRAGHASKGGLPPVPARPCLTINKTREPVRQVLNQERQSDLGIELVPADDFEGVSAPVDETEIELREGLVRRIQRESHAADARTWAFTRSTIAGRGYYGVMTRFVPGKTWDQEVYVQRFYNQAAVLLDPAHEQPDGSDAEWGFVGTWMPWAQYKSEFPSAARKRNVITDADSADFQTWANEQPEWFKSDGDLKAVYVTDYYYTTRTSRELALLPDGSAAWVDELPDGVTPEDTRTVVEKKISWCKLDGANEAPLEETDWPGHYIPIVKVLGEELQPYDGERRVEGMVRPARDSQQGFNAMISKWVEMVALAPIPAPMMANGQQEGFEAWWEAANTRTLPYLLYNAKDAEGNPVGPPSTVQRDVPISPVAASVQMFDEAIQSTTGVPESRVGKNTDSHLKSGKALAELRQSSEQGTSNYLDNLARSIRYEAIIENDLLYPIYGRPGRMARIVDAQGDAQTVLLHTPFTMQGKRPVAAQGQPPGQPPMPGAQAPKTYTLTEHANFNVAIKIARNHDTRRMAQTAILGDLISAQPELMMWFGDLFFKHQDGPGHDQMADRAKVMLDPKIQQMLASKDKGAAIPPEVQEKLAKAEEMVKAMTQQLEQLSRKVETEEIKAQREMQKAQLDAQTKLQIAQLEDATKRKIELARIAAANLTREDEQAHEMALATAQAGHDQTMAELTQRQQLDAALQGLAGDAALADQSHGQALEQGAQGAAAEATLADQGHAQALEQGQLGHEQAIEQQLMQPEQGAEL